ncbi:hypothetical protein ACG0UB_17090, partial [Klebsiella pneumoniae]
MGATGVFSRNAPRNPTPRPGKRSAKSTLIHQGEKAETLYYIVKGSVAVLIK